MFCIHRHYHLQQAVHLQAAQPASYGFDGQMKVRYAETENNANNYIQIDLLKF